MVIFWLFSEEVQIEQKICQNVGDAWDDHNDSSNDKFGLLMQKIWGVEQLRKIWKQKTKSMAPLITWQALIGRQWRHPPSALLWPNNSTKNMQEKWNIGGEGIPFYTPSVCRYDGGKGHLINPPPPSRRWNEQLLSAMWCFRACFHWQNLALLLRVTLQALGPSFWLLACRDAWRSSSGCSGWGPAQMGRFWFYTEGNFGEKLRRYLGKLSVLQFSWV